MKNNKKKGILTFLFSLLPGAGEMYMGLMKQGVSLMTMFLGSIAICSLLGTDILAFVGVIIWCYSFFHAGNVAASEEEVFFALQDNYIWTDFMDENNMQVMNPVFRKWGAGILVVLGVSMLWKNVSQFIYRLIPEQMWSMMAPVIEQIPEFVIALLLIVIGIRMIKGKKEELNADGK